MLFINSKITIQIKRNPFSTSLGLLERSANNHFWARTEIHYFQPAVMLMATIITVIGGLVTCCARKRHHYVTNIILPNPWRLVCKPQRCHKKEIIYEQNQWIVMTFHTCFLKCMEIRWFNTFSLQKGRCQVSQNRIFLLKHILWNLQPLHFSWNRHEKDTLWILFGNTPTNNFTSSESLFSP